MPEVYDTLDSGIYHFAALMSTIALWSTYPTHAAYILLHLEILCAGDDLYLYTYCGCYCPWAESTWPEVNRRGHQKHSICDARGPCQMIRSTMKAVFHQHRQFVELMSCLDVWIWLSGNFCDNDDKQQTDKTDCSTPCACARGNNQYHMSYWKKSFQGKKLL